MEISKYQSYRDKLVKELVGKGISNEKVLKAIATIPRHLFLDSVFFDKAYQNIAFPISSGQTISRPYTVAFQTELLQVEKGHKVLEIGTGSGYQSSVLVFLGVRLYTIERHYELFKKTEKFLRKIGYMPEKMIWGDGYKGIVEEAPFDRIIVTAGASSVPNDLLIQLAIGGKMVIPIGKEKQKMTLFERISQVEFHQTQYGDFEFIPMLEDRKIKQ